MRQSDIFDKLKERNPNLTEDTIKLILTSFHDGLRHYISHPEECKGGILVNELFALKINPKKIEKFIYDVKYNNAKYRSDFRVNHKTKEEIVEYYENLLKTITQYERQDGKKRHNDRSAGRVSNEISEAETD